jgi:Protein of unknown function (DUF4232)
MTDESYVEARRVRAALGTLLADEPTTDWTVEQDVARGRAERRRRRTRAGAALGLVAAAVVVLAVVGPMRPTPVSPAGQPAQGPAVVSLLEGFGFVVIDVAPGRGADGGPGTAVEYVVRPAEVPAGTRIRSTLAVGTFPAATGTATPGYPDGSVLATCTVATCVEPLVTAYDCSAPEACPDEVWTTVRAGHPSLPEGAVILLLRYASGAAVEGVASPPECITCNTSPFSVDAFLTRGQLRQVLTALGGPVAGTPAPDVSPSAAVSTPPSLPTCRADDVKVVPAVDADGGIPGERSFTLEITARSPESRCTMTGRPTLQLVAADGTPLDVRYQAGYYLRPEKFGPVDIGQASPEVGVVTVAQYRCDAGEAATATIALVTLPGDRTAITVEFPVGLAPRSCVGGAGAAGNTVYVSAVHSA